MKKPGPKTTPVADRIWQRITVTDAGCWEWDTLPPAGKGYGRIWVGSRSDGTRRMTYSHIAAYETFVGPVPEGAELDHLCRNRACCNPEHLDPVSHRENLMRSPIAPASLQARQTHCLREHEFTPENTYMSKGKRYCRACLNLRRNPNWREECSA